MGFISNLYNKIFNKKLKLNSGKRDIQFSNKEIEDFLKLILTKKGILNKDNSELTQENLEKLKNVCFETAISQKDLEEIMQKCPNLSQIDFRDVSLKDIDISNFNIKYLNLFNVLCENVNINNSNIEGLMISEMNMEDSKLRLPDNVKDLVLYDCNNIDINQFDNINPKRFSITTDTMKRDTEQIEVKNINNISKMNNIEVLGFRKVKNVDQLTDTMENIKDLSFFDCELKNIDNIANKFPNIHKLALSKNPIESMQPISEYNPEQLSKMNVYLNDTSITTKEADLIRNCNFECVELDDTPLQEELMSKVIVSVDDDKRKELSEALNNYIFDGGEEDITEWVRYQILLSREDESEEANVIRFSSEIADQVLSFDFVRDTADEMEIKVNNNTNIDILLKQLENNKGKKDRLVRLVINKISDIPTQYFDLLNSRYGITYRFEDETIDNNIYHIDELQTTDERIKDTFKTIDKSRTDEEKFKEIDDVIKKEFTFLLPERENYNFNTKELTGKDKEFATALNSIKYVKNQIEIDEYNNIYRALKDKKLTSKSYTKIIYELADILEIEGNIEYRLKFNQPIEITANTKNEEGKNVIIKMDGINDIDKEVLKNDIDLER